MFLAGGSHGANERGPVIGTDVIIDNGKAGVEGRHDLKGRLGAIRGENVMAAPVHDMLDC
jgi:hypothetical protein